MKKITVFIAVLLLLGACKSYTPDELDPSSDPVFSITGNFNGIAISLDANTDYITKSAFDQDSLDVVYYSSEMTKCDNCPSDFIMRWRSNDIDNPRIVETLMENEPPYRINMQDVYNVTFRPLTTAYALNYTWKIDGNTYLTDSTDTVFKTQFLASKDITKFPVQLDVEYWSGCKASIIDTVYLPNHGCDCDIQAKRVDSLHVNYKAQVSGGNSYEYQWQFDAGNQASSSAVNYYYDQPPIDRVDEVSLSVKSGNCMASSRWNQLFFQNSSTCAINFSKSIETQSMIVPGANNIDLGKIELEYTDQNGVTWKSIMAEQDQTSSFQVLSVEEYVDPFISTSKRSLKVEAEFNCLMSNGSETKRLTNGKLILPLGLGAN